MDEPRAPESEALRRSQSGMASSRGCKRGDGGRVPECEGTLEVCKVREHQQPFVQQRSLQNRGRARLRGNCLVPDRWRVKPGEQVRSSPAECIGNGWVEGASCARSNDLDRARRPAEAKLEV